MVAMQNPTNGLDYVLFYNRLVDNRCVVKVESKAIGNLIYNICAPQGTTEVRKPHCACPL